MNLIVYKGFSLNFLEGIEEKPLVETEVSDKVDIMSFDRRTRKRLNMALIEMDENDTVWITYEEYSLIKAQIDEAIKEDK